MRIQVFERLDLKVLKDCFLMVLRILKDCFLMVLRILKDCFLMVLRVLTIMTILGRVTSNIVWILRISFL